MGNFGSKRNDSPPTESMAEFFPQPSPGLGVHAPFIGGDLRRAESVTSIKDEMDEILRMISRIILCYIKDGQKAPMNEGTQSFNDSLFLRKKWHSVVYSHPCDLMPSFVYNQHYIKPQESIPNSDQISEFISPIFDKLNIQNECLLMMLIYIDRAITEGGVHINKDNWRPILYTSLLLSGKMLEDLCISNQDFTMIYPFFSLNSTNALERQFTTLLGWNLFISPEQYGNYFFKIQNMIHSSDQFLLRKLSRQSSLREEAK